MRMAKNHDKFWRTARISITIGTILVAVAVAYGTLRERVNTNKNNIEGVVKKADESQTAVVEMKADIKYIKEAVARIETKIDDRR